ncbi:MAG: SDR family oxidoreductase [Pseudomonadales bacterium]|nr:SDR family oxidoreductase [Pseudomonadales bacterium]
MGSYAMTGGATGIGAAIKQRLRGAGHTVIVVDVKDADVIADLGTRAGRDTAIEGIRARAGDGLDGFVACAGLGGHVPDRALLASVNYFGAVHLVEGLKDLVAAREGAIVLISSNSAPMPTSEEFVNRLLEDNEDAARALAIGMQGHPVYSGSKLALARWMRRNTAGYAALGVRLNAVAPGYTETPMTEQVAKDPVMGDSIRAFIASIPLRRPGKPDDIAAAVSYLLGPDASFVCGSVLFVDGGHDAMLRPDQF